MLKIIDITKAYALEKKESVQALKGVSIEFRRNEFVSILGPSGCGKTTLLNIIGGLDRYTSGDIQIEGIYTKEYDDVDWTFCFLSPTDAFFFESVFLGLVQGRTRL